LSTGTSWVPIGTCGILVVARPSRPSRPWPGTCGHMAAWCCLFRWWKGYFMIWLWINTYKYHF
jgi:hypothetical protein